MSSLLYILYVTSKRKRLTARLISARVMSSKHLEMLVIITAMSTLTSFSHQGLPESKHHFDCIAFGRVRRVEEDCVVVLIYKTYELLFVD